MPNQAAHTGRAGAAVLRRDVDFYQRLATHIGLPPTPFMLPFMGRPAEELASRRAFDAACWREFRENVSLIHPSLPVWTLTTAEDGQILSSVAERMVYESLQPRLSASVWLIVHPVIAPSRKWAADFALMDSRTEATTHVEVAGLLASDWLPRTDREAGYKVHFIAKLAAYAEAGLRRPAIIHIDQICDPIRLRMAVDAVLAQLGGLAA